MAGSHKIVKFYVLHKQIQAHPHIHMADDMQIRIRRKKNTEIIMHTIMTM